MVMLLKTLEKIWKKNPSWTWEIIEFSRSLIFLTHTDVGPTHGLTICVSREDQTPRGYGNFPMNMGHDITSGVSTWKERKVWLWKVLDHSPFEMDSFIVEITSYKFKCIFNITSFKNLNKILNKITLWSNKKKKKSKILTTLNLLHV